MKTKLVTLIATSCFALNAFAAVDPAAKEETTPPSAEGALPADSIPPINVGKLATPAAPQTLAPAANRNAPTQTTIPVNPPIQQ